MPSDKQRERVRIVGIIVDTDRLRREMALRTWSATDLAVISDVSRPSITNVLAGRPVKPTTLRKIIAALESTHVVPGAERIV